MIIRDKSVGCAEQSEAPRSSTHPICYLMYSEQLVGEVFTMTTIILNDELTDKVVKIGNYKSPQEVVDAILPEYIQACSDT